MSRYLSHIAFFLFLVIMAAMALPSRVCSERVRTVRIAAFNYYPAIFLDADGEVKGFYVDILAELARMEDLRFEYVFGSWQDGLERIQRGEVDVLTSVAFTRERAEFLDYGRIPLLTVWGELYAKPESPVASIKDIDGKRVAVMKGDFNAQYFMELVAKFGFTPDYIELDDFSLVFEAVRKGQTDAGIVNSVFGGARQKAYDLHSTGVIFNPFDIYFAVAKGAHSDLLAVLDAYLEDWRGEKSSIYYQAQLKWRHGPVLPEEVLPKWVYKGAAGLLVLIAISLMFIGLLRRRVRHATQELVQREARLQESNNMIHLLLNSTAEAIYGLDLNGRCTFCNDACLKLLGYERPDQLIGKDMHRLIHHSYVDGSPMGINDCLFYLAFQRGEKAHVDSDVLWRADGSSFPAEYWSHPVRHDDQIIGAVVTFLDISERKQAEIALKNKNAEMEQFVYAVSHDLRSPLVTMRSFLELLEQDLANNQHEEIQQDLSYMKAAGEKMERLLGELLQLSRAGRVNQAPMMVEYTELVNDVLSTLKGQFLDKDVRVNFTGDDLCLLGDALQLSHIWQNLIENAVKYMGKQPRPEILIGTETQGSEKTFYVCDNGMGIAAEYHDKIFGVFEKIDRQSDGSGLGLALVKKIVEAYEGRIWVESEGLGKGSCFKFILPKAFN